MPHTRLSPIRELILVQRPVENIDLETESEVVSGRKLIRGFIPVTMTESEIIWYVVAFVIIIIACCLMCWLLKQLVIFGVLIAIFGGCWYWYVYIYRNHDDNVV